MNLTLLQVIFEQSPVGIAVLSPDEVLLIVNHTYCNQTGYSRQELEGTFAWRLIHPVDGPGQRVLFSQLLKGEREVIESEHTILKKDGSVLVASVQSRLVQHSPGKIDYIVSFFSFAAGEKQPEPGNCIAQPFSVEDLSSTRNWDDSRPNAFREITPGSQAWKEWLQAKAQREGEEMERKRLARELHDGLGQMLNVLKLSLMREGISTQSQQKLEETLTEAERITNNLMPLVLENAGLEAAIRHLLEQYQPTTEAELYFYSNMAGRRYHTDLETGIFRLIQESLSNAVTYANASQISIQLTHNAKYLLLMVEDDGKGMDLAALRQQPSRGYGLVNMQARVESLRGKLVIESRPGWGCLIQAEIPVTF